MKYSLTLHDLSAKQVVEILETTNVDEVGGCGGDYKVAPIGSAAAIAAATKQNVAAAQSLLTASTDELLESAGTPGELDSENLPWDGRIHSGSKKKNTDGKWKLLKNVDPALVASVKAELSNRVPMTQILIPPAVPAFLHDTPSANVSAPVAAPATFVAPVAAPAPIMAQPQAPLARDFSGLMMQISKLFATKQITPDYPNTIVSRVNTGFGVNIATLTDVQNDPRMVEYSWQCLEVDGKAA